MDLPVGTSDGSDGPESAEISTAPESFGLRRLSDPRAMRALTHPVRLALIEALTLHGSLTATAAGQLIDETATTCSFHLRQLARYGFVEEAGGGTGRARPWRLLSIGWSIDNRLAATAPAGAALVEVALDRMVARHRLAQRDASHRTGAGADTGGATSGGTETGEGVVPTPSTDETIWWVTPAELGDLRKEIDSLVFRFRDRLVEPARRPASAVAIEFVALTHPMESPVDRSAGTGRP